MPGYASIATSGDLPPLVLLQYNINRIPPSQGFVARPVADELAIDSVPFDGLTVLPGSAPPQSDRSIENPHRHPAL
jgi:hypothetical protein